MEKLALMEMVNTMPPSNPAIRPEIAPIFNELFMS